MEQPKFELEQLLKAKRFEMPDEAFWDAFDARLKERLACEVQPRRVSVSFGNLFGAWLRRWAPVAAVGLLVFGGVWRFSSRFNAPHWEVCYEPFDPHACHLLSFRTSVSSELVKSVLSKKGVASANDGCFTF